MSVPETKKKTIIALFFISVLLLLIDIAVNKFYPSPSQPEELREITADEVNSRFRKAILNYGFDESWLVLKNKTGQQDIYNYLVRVPPDVPISLLLKEVKNSYLPAEADVFAEEKKINGKNYLKILSHGKLKLQSEFSYVKELNRISASSGVLLLDAENLPPEDLKNLLLIPEHFGIVLVPAKNSSLFAKQFTGAGKETVILLNDDIKELEYKLGPGFTDGRIRDVVRTIVGTFPHAAFYLIDAASSIYNSPVRDKIINEFTKRSIKIIPSGELIYYQENSTSGWDRVIQKSDKNRLIAIPADLYLDLQEEVERVRKIGYKFVNPSEIVN